MPQSFIIAGKNSVAIRDPGSIEQVLRVEGKYPERGLGDGYSWLYKNRAKQLPILPVLLVCKLEGQRNGRDGSWGEWAWNARGGFLGERGRGAPSNEIHLLIADSYNFFSTPECAWVIILVSL